LKDYSKFPSVYFLQWAIEGGQVSIQE
jgi:hypothetical protein